MTEVPLATTCVEASGRFSLSFRAVSAGGRRRLYFCVLDALGSVLLSTKGTVEWAIGAPPRDVLLLLPQDGGAPPGAPPSGPVVTGTVLQANGGPVDGANVRVFHKALRHETLLGEAKTSARGAYRVTYTAQQVSETHSVNLIARVYDGPGTELGASPVLFRAPMAAQLNVVVGGATYVGFSEFESVSQAVTPELDGVAPAALTADDVAFLASDTALGPASIQAYADANRLAAIFGVSSQAVYALLREGLPADATKLAASSPDVLRGAIAKAVSSNIVPASLHDSIDAILATLSAWTVRAALAPPDMGRLNVGSILHLGGAPASVEQQTLEAFAAAPSAAFTKDTWARIRSQAGAANGSAVDRAQLAIQLGVLTHNHIPLVTHLLGLSGAQQVSSLRDLATLAREDWYSKLSVSEAGQPIGVPTDAPGTTDEQRRWSYATTLYRTIEEAYPADVLLALALKGTPSTATADLARFVRQAQDFHLTTTRIDPYLKANPASTAGVTDVVALTNVLKAWQRVARVTPRVDEIQALSSAGLTSAQAIARMGWGGFVSTFAPKLGEERANIIFGNALHAAHAAFALYARFNPALNSPWMPTLNYLDPASFVQVFQQTGAAQNLPDYASLFGTLDSCVCGDCRSITSPAAYLVDLLQFMGPVAQSVLRIRRPDLFGTYLSCANTNTPMPYIDLVNEVLEFAVTDPPVNGLPVPPPSWVHSPGVQWPNQTTESADVLAAEPQYISVGAYSVLASAVYPWSLPFSLGLEEARIYSTHLGVDVASMMEVLQPPPVASATVRRDNIARARLDMTSTEWDVITSGPAAVAPPVKLAYADPSNPTTLTGLGAGAGGNPAPAAGDRVLVADRALSPPSTPTPPAISNGIYIAAVGAWSRAPDASGALPAGLLIPVAAGPNAGEVFALVSPSPVTAGVTPLEFRPFSAAKSLSAFMQQTGLTYADLLDLLATSYMNLPFLPPAVSVQLDPATCDLDTATLSGFTPAVLDRIHRFTRLRKRLGWTPYQLDTAIRAFGVSGLTPTLLEYVADAKALQAALSVDVVEMLSWWAPHLETTIYRDGSPSLYDTTFLNATALSTGELGVFALDSTRQRLPTTELWQNHVPSLCAALGLSPADLGVAAQGVSAVVPGGTPDVAPAAALTLRDLTVVYRTASLARALGMTITEIQVLRALTTLNPFSSPSAAREFVRAREAIRASAFRLDEVAQLLLGIATAPSAPFLTPDAAVSLLTDVQVGLQKIAAQYALTADSNGEKLRAALAAALAAVVPSDPTSQAALDPLMAIVAGTSTLVPADQQTELHKYLDPIVGAAAVTAIIATLSAPPPPPPAPPPPISSRYGAVLAPVLVVLSASLSQNLVTQKLAAAFTMDVAAMRVLLSQGIHSAAPGAPPSRMAMAELVDSGFVQGASLTNTDPGGGPSPARTAYVLFQTVLYPTLLLIAKAALIVGRFKLSVGELVFTRTGAASPMFVGGDPAIGWLNLNSLPGQPTLPPSAAYLTSWQDEVSAFAFRDKFAVVGTGVLQLLDAAATSPAVAGAVPPPYIQSLASMTGWSPVDIAALVETGPSGLGLLYPADYASGAALATLTIAEALLARLGASAAQALAWATDPAGSSAAIKAAAKAKYDQAGWLAVAKPLRDVLRVQQRDALVAWLIGHAGFPDSNALFDAYLIDVEMSACRLTSRIKQAIGATQLFIQRMLMNLESGRWVNSPETLTLSPQQAAQWSWIGNSLLWQANREVLLFPENWLDPTLRDDMTPFFQDLANELNQTNVTADSAEVVFRNYLQKLRDVARLFVVATYTDPDTNVVHVVGRTDGHAPKYYYRMYESSPYAAWTPWTPVPVDVTGDDILLVVWNRQLCLLWATFTPLQNQNPSISYPASDGSNIAGNIPEQLFNIQIAMTKFRDGAWSPKSVTAAGISSAHILGGVDSPPPWLDSLVFTASVSDDPSGAQNLLVNVTGGQGGLSTANVTYGGTFVFPGAGGEATVSVAGGVVVPTLPPNASFAGEWLTYETSPSSAFYVFDWDQSPTLVLGTVTPGSTFVEQRTASDYDFALNSTSFFFQDFTRCFFVQSYAHVLEWWQRDGVSPAFLREVSARLPYIIAGDAPPQAAAAPAAAGPGAAAPAEAPARDVYAFAPTASGQQARAVATSPYAAPRGMASGQMSTLPTVSARNYGQAKAVRLDPFFGIGLPWFVFSSFYHPYVSEALGRLNRFGVDGLLSWRFQEQPQLGLVGPELQLLNNQYFTATYQPAPWVGEPFGPNPDDSFDVSFNGAYSIYNWEVFFHAPLLIAQKLTTNHQFAEAKRWLEYVFDPTDTNPGFGPTARYWKFKKFFDDASAYGVPPNILAILMGTDPTSPDSQSFNAQVTTYEDDPFNPFAIARLRTAAFEKATVMAYVDNLIAWGDNLFAQNTLESINEATLMYVLASEILGDRPARIDSPSSPTDALSYDQLVAQSGVLGPLSDPLVSLENILPPSIVNYPANENGAAPPQVLFFCVPGNDALLARWDTVADRLTKIRNCMNIQGQVEQLPLFEPPINPGLLVRAAAAGVDLNSVLSDMGAPLPYYRFQTMTQKATEFVGEVRALGQALLAALEKQDAESLAVLRANQEVQILQSALDAKQQALNEAGAAYSALNQSQQIATARQQYYTGLLASAPGGLIPEEQQQLDKLGAVTDFQGKAQGHAQTASILAALPGFSIGFAGVGGSPQGNVSFSGSELAAPDQYQAAEQTFSANQANNEANRAQVTATQVRRAQDWQFQANMAGMDFTQIGFQMQAAQDRIAFATDELATHQTQIQNAQDVATFLKNKYTSTQLYSWMVSQISATYFQMYQLAYGLSKKAEVAFHREIADYTAAGGSASPAVNYVQFGYWDSLKQGLLAGDRLAYDLKRMESAYLDQNRREFEITRHVSLLEFDPVALIQLRQSGVCYVYLPESLFDGDFPGHYLRRVKAVGVTIPCAVGPYTSVNCTLTLVRHCTRWNSTPSSYTPADFSKPDTSQFLYNLAALESVVTSTGQTDGGLFEVNLRDERYLPFEGAGVVSLWRVELPPDANGFDTTSITDFILHLRYTSRDGGESMKSQARAAVKLGYTPPPAPALTLKAPTPTRLFLASQDLSDAFYRFMNPDPSAAGQEFGVDLSDTRFPFHDAAVSISMVRVFLVLNPVAVGSTGLKATLVDPSGKVYPASPATAPAFQATDLALPNLLVADFPIAPPFSVPVGAAGSASTWALKVAEGDIQTGSTGLGVTVGSHTRIDPNKLADVGILCLFG